MSIILSFCTDSLFIPSKLLKKIVFPIFYKNHKEICLQCGRPSFDSWMGKIPWRKECLPTAVFFFTASAVALMVKNLPAVEIRVQFLGQEDPLEKEMATDSSILAWEIP